MLAPDPTYISHIIAQVNEVTERCGSILLYGENINYGSRIGGLARGLTVNPDGCIQNVGNCELTHVGVGLGMLLDGGQAVLFGKQLDFILLGLEQVCNTYNSIRAYRPRSTWGSFTIFVVVCDQGYQGPQSSLNGAGDFASLANIPVYCLNGAADAAGVVQRRFASPGFRIICLSQRLFGAPLVDLPAEWAAADDSIFRYKSGLDITTVSFNFSLRDAVDVDDQLRSAGIHGDLFHVNFVPGMDLRVLVDSCRRTRKLILIDDSKTVTKFGDSLVTELARQAVDVSVLSLCRRGCDDNRYGANEDRFVPDAEQAVAFGRAS
jgi:acetoin:2,6-dichlorophenolindophenol oxidoreductase subunit beta